MIVLTAYFLRDVENVDTQPEQKRTKGKHIVPVYTEEAVPCSVCKRHSTSDTPVTQHLYSIRMLYRGKYTARQQSVMLVLLRL